MTCIEENTDFAGNDLKKVETIQSAYECACACKEFAGCSVFTWNAKNKNCYLKTSKKGRRPIADAHSGSVDCCEGNGQNCKGWLPPPTPQKRKKKRFQ